MLKIFYTHQKKKTNFHSKKKCLMLTQKHAQKESFFQTKQYFTPTWKSQFISRWNNFSLQFEKTEIPPEKNFLYYHRKSNFPTEKIIILFRKNPISEGKNILYLSEKNSKFLILTLPRPYPPLPVKKRFLKQKKLEVSYIYPPPPHPPPLSPVKKRFVIQKKSNILHFRRVLNTALLLF